MRYVTMGLMCHVVAGYPSKQECIELMLGMQKVGVQIIEVQIPFSDPIADGETIMRANDKALENGMSVSASFDLINHARKEGLNSKLYVMSYFQKVFAFGLERFCQEAKRAEASGLIVPDLPFDAPEYELLIKVLKKHKLDIVPVASPSISPERLKAEIISAGELIYLTSVRGITGGQMKLTKDLAKTAEQIRKVKPNVSLAIGFGIENKEDAKKVLEIADLAIVGSALIRSLNKGGVNETLKLVNQIAQAR